MGRVEDQRLDLQEFTRMIKTHLKELLKSSWSLTRRPLQDVEFTKGETNEVFKRINSSGTGQMTLQELEMALEAAGAKCYVSEAWVKETLQQFTVAVQEAGLNIKQLWAGGSVTEKASRRPRSLEVLEVERWAFGGVSRLFEAFSVLIWLKLGCGGVPRHGLALPDAVETLATGAGPLFFAFRGPGS